MITARDAADAITYLIAAGATTARDAQAVVWADYLNAQADNPEAVELRPAARDAIRHWDDAGRTWQVNVETLAKALRRRRAARVADVEQAGGRPAPDGLDDDPDARCRWVAAWRRAVGIGATPARADALAWAAIGRCPPAPLPAAGPRGRERARAVLAALADRHRSPEDPRTGDPAADPTPGPYPNRHAEAPGTAERGSSGTWGCHRKFSPALAPPRGNRP